MSGLQRFTEDGAVLASGRPVVVYGVCVGSDVAAGTAILRNGTSTAAAIAATFTGTAGQSRLLPFGVGVVFPNGCYVDIDANTLFTTVIFEAL